METLTADRSDEVFKIGPRLRPRQTVQNQASLDGAPAPPPEKFSKPTRSLQDRAPQGHWKNVQNQSSFRSGPGPCPSVRDQSSFQDRAPAPAPVFKISQVSEIGPRPRLQCSKTVKSSRSGPGPNVDHRSCLIHGSPVLTHLHELLSFASTVRTKLSGLIDW